MSKKKLVILLVTLVSLPVLGGAIILWLGGDANKAGVTRKDMIMPATPAKGQKQNANPVQAEEGTYSLSQHKTVDSGPSLDHTDAGQLPDVIDIKTFLHEKDLRAKLIQTHRANKKEFTIEAKAALRRQVSIQTGDTNAPIGDTSQASTLGSSRQRNKDLGQIKLRQKLLEERISTGKGL